MQNSVNHFSLAEEILHAITHGIGFLLSIAGLAMVIVAASAGGHAIAITSASVYGATLMLMYGSSTLYHALPHTGIKRLFQKFDHSAIYFLIAGTYTPVMLVSVGGAAGWTIFGIEWGIALAGIALKFLFPGRLETLSLIAYTGGVIFYVKDNITYFHTIWHLFVIAGSALHFFAILFYVLPVKG